MKRIRLVYALVLGLALYGCDEAIDMVDSGSEKDASSEQEDSGLNARDPEADEDLCSGVICPDDGNICTESRCDPGSGECETIALSHVSCDDGLFCNGNDMCINGECTHSGDPCGGGDSCVEEHQSCGCADASDCPDDPWGSWSACDCGDASNICKNAGTRIRSRLIYTCENALCVVTDSVETDTGSCTCDTDGLECNITGGAQGDGCNWGACAGGTCAAHKCSGALAACDNEAKACVECLSDAYCGGTKPRCNTAMKKCMGCVADTDCAASGAPYCDTAAGECVECLLSSHCGDGEGCCITGPWKYTCRPELTVCLPIADPTTATITSGPVVARPTLSPPPLLASP